MRVLNIMNHESRSLATL